MVEAAWAALAAWMYLIFGRGGFWLVSEGQHCVKRRRPKPSWPSVTAVIPARNEAAHIGDLVSSLLRQEYPGSFRLVVVDDDSEDRTSAAAANAAANMAASDRTTVMRGRPLRRGWTGKVWALEQGVRASTQDDSPEYLLFTDADISYAPGVLSQLVARALDDDLVLVSIMAKLHCETFAEKSTIPAFVYFFKMLYPFSWVNRSDRSTAAAAGGCMLVKTEALRAAGGLDAIHDALIDDCALAKHLKRVGPIRIGLSNSVHSNRSYRSFGPIRDMVVRSAYAELRFSPLRLFMSMIGMGLCFLMPAALALFGSGWAALLGAVAWILMALSFQPMLLFYELSPLWGFALPLIAAVYMAWTLESALRHVQGRGGAWKGRLQTTPGGAP